MCTLISSTNTDILTPSFPICIISSHFVAEFAMARTSRTILNRCRRVDSLVLSLILVGLLQVSSYLFLCCPLTCYILHLLYLGMSIDFLISPIILGKRALVFYQRFFQNLMSWSCVFFSPLNLFRECIMLVDIHIWNHHYITGMKLTCSY